MCVALWLVSGLMGCLKLNNCHKRMWLRKNSPKRGSALKAEVVCQRRKKPVRTTGRLLFCHLSTIFQVIGSVCWKTLPGLNLSLSWGWPSDDPSYCIWIVLWFTENINNKKTVVMSFCVLNQNHLKRELSWIDFFLSLAVLEETAKIN